jgi:hypothetical protein
MHTTRTILALATFGIAALAASDARADDVTFHVDGRVVFHDPDNSDDPTTNDLVNHTGHKWWSYDLNGCRYSAAVGGKPWAIHPIRFARFEVRREKSGPTNPVEAQGWTDKDGKFSISVKGPSDAKYYVEVLTHDDKQFNRIDVMDDVGNTYRLPSAERKIGADRTIHFGDVDFDSNDNAARRCSGLVYAHVMNAYDKYFALTGRPRVLGNNGHVAVKYGFGWDGMTTLWDTIHIERKLDAWDLESIYHEFGHRIAFGADSPNSALPFLGDTMRNNAARTHNGSEVRQASYAWMEGWADFNHSVYRPELRSDGMLNWTGAVGDGVDDDVENDVASKLLAYAKQSAKQCAPLPPPGADGVAWAYKSFVETLIANPGSDAARITSSKGINSFRDFVRLHKARTGCDFPLPDPPKPTVSGAVVHQQKEKCDPDEAVSGIEGVFVEGRTSLPTIAGFMTFRLSHPASFKWKCGKNTPESTTCGSQANLVRITRGKEPDGTPNSRRVLFTCMKGPDSAPSSSPQVAPSVTPPATPKIVGTPLHTQLEGCNADEAVWDIGGSLIDGVAKLTAPGQFSTYHLTHPMGFQWRCGNNKPETISCKDPKANMVQITRGHEPNGTAAPRRVIFSCQKRLN